MKRLIFILFPLVSFSQEITQGNANYDAFPYPVVLKDTLLFFFKSSATHGAEGKTMMARSFNGGLTSEISQVNLASMDSCTNLCVGMGKGNVIILGVKNSFSGESIIFARSSDGGRNWVQGGRYGPSNSIWPFGRIIKVYNDSIIASYYQTGAWTHATYLMYSTNNGDSWHFYDTLAYNAAQSYNEADVAYIGKKKLMAVVRNETLSRPVQFSSTDNGHTWTRVGGLNLLNFATNNTPTFIENYNGRIWLFSNFRAGDGNHSVWWYSNGLESQVFTDTSKWAKRSAYYHPLNDDLNDATLGIHNGYTVPFQFQGKLYTVGYDNTPLQANTTTIKTRILVHQIKGTGDFVKAYNDANQSISNTTLTKISYPQIDLNDALTYNTDSNFVIIQNDGWYSIDAAATFDTSSVGTRKMYIFLVSNSLKATTSAQPQILSQTTVHGSSDSDYNRLECHVKWLLRKNEKIQIFVYQDSGEALNLFNTDRNRMATLIIKRID